MKLETITNKELTNLLKGRKRKIVGSGVIKIT
jgi:hypothetical protein